MLYLHHSFTYHYSDYMVSKIVVELLWWWWDELLWHLYAVLRVHFFQKLSIFEKLRPQWCSGSWIMNLTSILRRMRPLCINSLLEKIWACDERLWRHIYYKSQIIAQLNRNWTGMGPAGMGKAVWKNGKSYWNGKSCWKKIFLQR